MANERILSTKMEKRDGTEKESRKRKSTNKKSDSADKSKTDESMDTDEEMTTDDETTVRATATRCRSLDPFQKKRQRKRRFSEQKENRLNILLLGETGVGKSTWINGLVNYFKFNSLKEAKAYEFKPVIPIKFSMTDDNYEELRVAVGDDTNEDSKDGESSTQKAKLHEFKCGETTVRIIDTPGVGDTRGIEKDKENFKNIMKHVEDVADELHGICILLKPNNARLTVMFQFCIQQLLAHIDKKAFRNIVFCFTHSRNTFYKPGDTMPALRQLLQEFKQADIDLNEKTLYCIDNEAIRFLAALKCHVPFDDKEERAVEQSWNKSALEAQRLIKYFRTLTPYSIKYSQSLKKANTLLMLLAKPMFDIYVNIEQNIAKLREQMTRDLSDDELYITTDILKPERLRVPDTICMSNLPRCGKKKHHQNLTACHESCSCIRDVCLEDINCDALQICDVMGKGSGNLTCKSCGCPSNVHMQIYYKIGQTEAYDSTSGMLGEDDKSKMIVKHREALNRWVGDLADVKHKICEACVKLSCLAEEFQFSNYTAILTYFFDKLILEENQQAQQSKQDLEKIRAAFTEHILHRKVVLEDADSKMNVRAFVEDKVTKIIENLTKLKIGGVSMDEIFIISLERYWADVKKDNAERDTGKKRLNILVLGETGVGKSTWINGLAQYFKCESLADARLKIKKFEPVVPIKFTITDEDYNEKVIQIGGDESEDPKAGASATQYSKQYRFQHGETEVCITDTPGIGDTRGVEIDKENFDNIMKHVAHLDRVHGICILLKPNNARLTVMFRFCMQQLLKYVNKEAFGNIVFCFTHSRNTFYKPGDTMPALRELLQDYADTNITLSEDTVYCIDNEAVRFLAAEKSGVKFEERDVKAISQSWEKSVAEAERLIKHFQQIQPFTVPDVIQPEPKKLKKLDKKASSEPPAKDKMIAHKPSAADPIDDKKKSQADTTQSEFPSRNSTQYKSDRPASKHPDRTSSSYQSDRHMANKQSPSGDNYDGVDYKPFAKPPRFNRDSSGSHPARSVAVAQSASKDDTNYQDDKPITKSQLPSTNKSKDVANKPKQNIPASSLRSSNTNSDGGIETRPRGNKKTSNADDIVSEPAYQEATPRRDEIPPSRPKKKGKVPRWLSRLFCGLVK